jgi:hypothetical protein
MSNKYSRMLIIIAKEMDSIIEYVILLIRSVFGKRIYPKKMPGKKNKIVPKILNINSNNILMFLLNQ